MAVNILWLCGISCWLVTDAEIDGTSSGVHVFLTNTLWIAVDFSELAVVMALTEALLETTALLHCSAVVAAVTGGTALTRVTGAVTNVIVGDLPVLVTVRGELFTNVNCGAVVTPDVTHNDLTTVKGPEEFKTVIRGEFTTFCKTAVPPLFTAAVFVTMIFATLFGAALGSTGELVLVGEGVTVGAAVAASDTGTVATGVASAAVDSM